MIMQTRDTPPPQRHKGHAALRQLEQALRAVADEGLTLRLIDGELRADVNGDPDNQKIRSYGVFKK